MGGGARGGAGRRDLSPIESQVLAGLVQGCGWYVSGPCWGRAISGEGRLRLSRVEDATAGHPLPNRSLAAPSVCVPGRGWVLGLKPEFSLPSVPV